MPKLIDLTGATYGKLTVTGRAAQIRKGGSFWNCQCDCGNSTAVLFSNLTRGFTKSCGCIGGGILKDLSGCVFGKLMVIGRAPQIRKGGSFWNCLCDCGNTTIVTAGNLKTGHTESCGCLLATRRTHNSPHSAMLVKHGMAGTKIYAIWNGILQRCLNPSNSRYNRYGGRGITVDSCWLDFEVFYKDMGGTYFDAASIERVNVNGNYCKENCTWITRKEQSFNKENTIKIEFGGQTRRLADVAKEFSLSHATLKRRVFSMGMTVEDAIFCHNKKHAP